MQPKILLDLKSLILRGLEDDGYALDWTTLGTEAARPSGDRKVRARIVAKAEGVWFGELAVEAAARVSAEIGFDFSAKSLVKDGTRVKPKTVVAEWRGSAAGILAVERPFLNVVSHLSGIATRTAALVAIVESKSKKGAKAPRVTSTRKILPHYRDVAIAAVMAGGGRAHRASLAGGVLIKENHVAAAGGIAAAIRGARKVAPHLLAIEIEVRNLRELRQALAEDADVVMLDNFSPEEARAALEVIRESGRSPIVECSGGISEATIGAYAAIPGIDLLSVGGLTHSVNALDLSLLVD
jgi:nicotinate-nucleotide pyrophosphorylase (carboxylating)